MNKDVRIQVREVIFIYQNLNFNIQNKIVLHKLIKLKNHLKKRKIKILVMILNLFLVDVMDARSLLKQKDQRNYENAHWGS